jgi:hypothetical protein
MQKINSIDMFYTGNEILVLWQLHNASLDENRKKEFLVSTEISELVKLIKPVVKTAIRQDRSITTSKIYRQGEFVWIIEQPGESWGKFRKNSLLLAWEWKYGGLSPTKRELFLEKKELDSIIRFRKSLVVEELNNHKRLINLLVALQDSAVEKEYRWVPQVVEAEKLFNRLQDKFAAEILKKRKMLTSKEILRHDTICNACGMILPIFNYHDCN